MRKRSSTVIVFRNDQTILSEYYYYYYYYYFNSNHMYCIVTKGRDGKHLRDKLGQKDGELKRLQEKLSLCCDSPSQFLTPGSQHRHGGTHD